MLWIALAALTTPLPQDRVAGTGAIEGLVRDVKERPVEGAFVVLCEAASGMPLGAKTQRPFLSLSPKGYPDIDDWLFARSDAEGRFRFPSVPGGEYRLVAQSFPDVEDVAKPLDEHGLAVHLRGVAEGVVVPSEAARRVTIDPLGSASFVYHKGAGNDDWYLFLSVGRLAGDRILGPLAWRGEFLRKGVGWARMNDGQALVRGLPGRRIDYAIFANDSNPGIGGGSFYAFDGQVVAHATGIIASWSDGHRDPPERLVALVDEVATLVAEDEDAIDALLIQGREEAWNAREPRDGFGATWDRIDILGPLEREVVMPSGLRTTFADILAAEGYVRLRR